MLKVNYQMYSFCLVDPIFKIDAQPPPPSKIVNPCKLFWSISRPQRCLYSELNRERYFTRIISEKNHCCSNQLTESHRR